MANNVVIDSRWRKKSSIEERYIKSEVMALSLANKLQELSIESESFHRPDSITVTKVLSKEHVFEARVR